MWLDPRTVCGCLCLYWTLCSATSRVLALFLDTLSPFLLLDLGVWFGKIGMTVCIVTARGYGLGSCLGAQVRCAAPSTAGL